MARRSSEELRAVIRDFRRDQVIDVARRLFGEHGTIEVSMDEIATEAGVARSTVYVYFANRDELLRACLTRMHTQLLDEIAEAWEQDSGPMDRLVSLVEGMFERIDEDPAFFRLALATQGVLDRSGQALGSELAVIGLRIARLLRDILEEGMVAGIFRRMDLDVATALVGQQIYGAMSVRAGEPVPAPRAESAALVCEFMRHGLAG